MNVTIVDFESRKNREGEHFFALILTGETSFVKSLTTGNYYVTKTRASIPTTLDEHECENLIGKEIPGKIERVACEAYKYTHEETGEVIEISHRFVYLKEGDTVEDIIHEGKVVEEEQQEPVEAL